MVYEIVKLRSKHRIFIETLILTFLILIIGLFLGFYIEYNRTKNIIEDYKSFEIEALNLRLQNYYYQTIELADCDRAIQENLRFADEIYEKGLKIQKYEDVNELTEDLLLEKKKYVLLKTELWLNSILLKQKCKNPFNTISYIYTQNENFAKEAEQSAISNVLGEIKKDKGNDVILLPIAGDLDLSSVNLFLRVYNITYLPSIVINEEIVLEGFHGKEKIVQYLK